MKPAGRLPMDTARTGRQAEYIFPCVELPLPPSVNRTYKAGWRREGDDIKPAFYKDRGAKGWQETAGNLLFVSWGRFLPLPIPKGAQAEIHCNLIARSRSLRDIDAGIKLALDAICTTLTINDRYVTELHIKKRVTPTAEHGMTTWVTVIVTNPPG